MGMIFKKQKRYGHDKEDSTVPQRAVLQLGISGLASCLSAGSGTWWGAHLWASQGWKSSGCVNNKELPRPPMSQAEQRAWHACFLLPPSSLEKLCLQNYQAGEEKLFFSHCFPLPTTKNWHACLNLKTPQKDVTNNKWKTHDILFGTSWGDKYSQDWWHIWQTPKTGRQRNSTSFWWKCVCGLSCPSFMEKAGSRPVCLSGCIHCPFNSDTSPSISVDWGRWHSHCFLNSLLWATFMFSRLDVTHGICFSFMVARLLSNIILSTLLPAYLCFLWPVWFLICVNGSPGFAAWGWKAIYQVGLLSAGFSFQMTGTWF